MTVALSSFALLFVAELGDKTQFAVLALAHRYRAAPVAMGVLTAFLVLNGIAVLVGETLYRHVPQSAVLAAAGALFLFFAYRSAREARQPEDAQESLARGGRGALLSSFFLILVTELGDKTQLALVGVTAKTGEPWSAFLGGTAALWSISLIALAVGTTLLRRLPRGWLHYGAAAMFLAFGLLTLGEALREAGMLGA